MTTPTPPDPGALFRELLSQWETLTNDWGGKVMKTGEFARTVHGATTATNQAREAMQMGFGRALAAANMPSKEDVQALGAQMAAVEARLGNIEALLIRLAGAPAQPPVPPRSRPRRTRTPPTA